jgi:hypothetical protein
VGFSTTVRVPAYTAHYRQFQLEADSPYPAGGLLEEVSWGGARALTELEEIWLSEQVLLSALGDS